MVDLPDVGVGSPHAAAHNAERDKINELSGRIVYGVGRPDTETAPIGTRYIDETQTNGAQVWERTGTEMESPSYWHVVLGDTGWRKLFPATSKLTGYLYVRRVNERIYLSSSGLSLQGATPLTEGEMIMYIPFGFLPSFPGELGAASGMQPIQGLWNVGTTEQPPAKRAQIKWENYPNIPIRLYGVTSAITGKLTFLWPPMVARIGGGPADTWPEELPPPATP